MKKEFSFKIYTPVEAMLVFLLTFSISMALFWLLRTYVDLQRWPSEILKVALLLSTLGLFGIARSLSTAKMSIVLDSIGLQFHVSKSRFGFRKPDDLITWLEIDQWGYRKGGLSSHSWSPDEFKIRCLNKKKKTFYIANDEASRAGFEQFLSYFLNEVSRFNVKNEQIGTIRKSKPLEQTKVFALLMIPVWLAVVALMIWAAFFNEVELQNKYLVYLFVPLFSGFMLWLCYKTIRNAFFK